MHISMANGYLLPINCKFFLNKCIILLKAAAIEVKCIRAIPALTARTNRTHGDKCGHWHIDHGYWIHVQP